MSKSDSQLDRLTLSPFGRIRKGASRFLLLRLPLLLLPLVVISGSATTARGAGVPSSSPASIPSFAVADLDGDHRPDLANIQVARTNPAGSDYWIELKLSAAGRQFIGLVAPPGGLAIEARDVNGDSDVDLVVRSAWLNTPIAIFLNDGHGRFLRAQPNAFPGAWNQANFGWNTVSTPEDQSIASLRTPLRDGISRQGSTSYHARPPTGATAAFAFDLAANPFLLPYAGRAPPSHEFYL